jgi:hypothetical protein
MPEGAMHERRDTREGFLYIARGQRTPHNLRLLLFSSFCSTSMICNIFKGLTLTQTQCLLINSRIKGLWMP